MSLNKYFYKKIFCVLLSVILLIQPISFNKSFAQTGTVNTDRLNVRSGPGTYYSSIKQLSTNSKVTIIEAMTGNDGMTWYRVNFSGGSGYIRSDFVNVDVTYSANDASFEQYLNSQGFPESYKNSLRGLHQKYPNWVFIAQHTGLDWNEVIREETKVGRNLVETDSISSWKSVEPGAFDWAGNYWPGFDGSTWVAASEEVIKHYMDPRNFLTDPYVFQFEVQRYDQSSQSREGLIKMTEGTFLSGYANGSNSSFSSDNSYGPGISKNSSSSSNSNSGPGVSGNNTGTYNGPGESGSTSNSSGPSSVNTIKDSSGSGNVFPGNITLVAPDISLFSFLGGINAFANWQLDGSRWIYKNNDGSLKTSGWYWLDGNNDGTAECYYFYSDGTMASDTTIDGYYVNSDGKWVENGVIKTKQTGSGPSSIASSSSGSGSRLYVDIIMDAAKQSGVSPYVLAAMIIQEQGKKGTSPLISGTYSGYNGYYNFYNIGAYEHDGMSAVEAGLKYASESGNGNRPWNSIEKAIIGGAIAYGANYTDSGQDTFYLKKYNVQGNNKYNHQYMTNVVAAAEEGAKVANAYSSEIKSGAIKFRIPIYNNMPDTPCELPVGTGNPNNKLSSLYVEGFVLTPTFNMNTSDYSLIVDSSVNNLNIIAQTIDQNAHVNGSGICSINEGLNNITITVTAQNGSVREYHLQVTRRPGGNVGNGSTGPSSFGPGTVNNSNNGINSNTGPAVITNNSTTNSSHESTIVIGAPPM